MEEAMIYDAFVTEEYEQNGEKKSRFFNIGVAFPAKKGNGVDLIVAQGISVTGRVSIRERKGQSVAGADADEIPY
jgi:hypothetical protein